MDMNIKKIIALISFGIIICLIIFSLIKGKGNSDSSNEETDSNSSLVDIEEEQSSDLKNQSILETENVDIELKDEKPIKDDNVTYELSNGTKVEISKNPQRIEYISDKEITKYVETATNLVYSIYDFDNYEEAKLLEHAMKYVQGDLKNNMEEVLGREKEKIELKYSKDEEGSLYEFPYDKYSQENKNVEVRTISKAKVTESESFAYPFLQLHVNVESTVTLKDGSQENRKNLFVVEFAVGEPKKAITLFMDEVPPTSDEQ